MLFPFYVPSIECECVRCIGIVLVFDVKIVRRYSIKLSVELPLQAVLVFYLTVGTKF